MAKKSKINRESKSVLVNFILDRSGSMEDVKDETIKGFNNYRKELLGQKGISYLMTLTLFGGPEVITKHAADPLEKVADLDNQSYRPDGYTPLYDAIGRTIREVERNLNGQAAKVVTVIMTDGLENSSREWDLGKIEKLMKEKEAEGNWTFVFLGASKEVWQQGVQLGVSMGNMAQYNPKSTGAVMKNLALATACYAQSRMAATGSYFADAGIKDINRLQSQKRRGSI